jgi:penicillin-binding protein 1C
MANYARIVLYRCNSIYTYIALQIFIVSAAWLIFATQPARIALPTAPTFVSSQAWLLDRHGSEIARIRVNDDAQRLAWVRLDDMSPALTRAVLAAEDARFYSHHGVDSFAVAAALKDALLWRKPRGASTITMQLVNLHHENAQRNRSLLQKLTQMRAAWQLERNYTKPQLLEAYLNTVTFRGELQGVASASQALFAKAPQGLSLQEAALLAVLIRAPQARPAQVAQRVCSLLRSLNEVVEACAQPINTNSAFALQLNAQLSKRSSMQSSSQLALHAAHKLLTQAGERRVSTLDAPLQRYAQQSLQSRLMELARQSVEDGAVVVLDNASGEVLAYVGSSGLLSQAQEVDAAAAPRQAGSTLKPFLYALALDEKRLTAASLLDDSPVAIQTADGQFIPRNYARDFKGWVSARRALASSLNVPAVRVLGMMDVERFAASLRSAGLASVSESGDYYGHSLALGSADVKLIELANAYRTLANRGVFSNVSFTPASTNKTSHRAFSAEAAAIISDVLSDNEARALSFGMDSVLRVPFWAAVKTGTSKDMRDNWCMGYSSRYTVGVWVGNAGGMPMRDVSGVQGAAPVWADIMQWLHRDVPSQPPKLPSSVVQQRVRFAGVNEAARAELFIAGTAQAQFALADTKQAANASHAAPSIISPLAGAIYAIDPDIPASRQSLLLKRSAGLASWRLDGVAISSASQRQDLAWRLSPGLHALELLDAHNTVLQRLSFEVRAPQRVAALNR